MACQPQRKTKTFTTVIVEVCDCPQIIYELSRFAGEPVPFERDGRKDIIGVLMQQMMDKAFNAPKSAWPTLLETGINSLRQKQPGVTGHTYEVEAFGKKQKAFPLDTDKEIIVELFSTTCFTSCSM